jgi:hypothetical protein
MSLKNLVQRIWSSGKDWNPVSLEYEIGHPLSHDVITHVLPVEEMCTLLVYLVYMMFHIYTLIKMLLPLDADRNGSL